MKYLIYILLSISLFELKAEMFSGKVIDAQTNEPLISASVILKELNKGIYSDRNGEFLLETNNEFNGTLIVSLIGYKSEIVDLSKVENKSSLIIRLDQSSLLSSEIVVSANKKIENVQEVPISVSVLSTQDIQFAGLNSAENVLDYVPGIKVNRDNISLRGSSGFSYGVGSRVSLLVDGFPMLAGDNGDMKFNGLPLFSAERIEVVKGAGSALYGTSAIGGVVNLITQTPTENKIKFRTYGGVFTPSTYEQWKFTDNSQQKYGLDLMAAGKSGKLSLLFNGSFYNDQSYRYYDKEQVVNGFLKLKYDHSDKHQYTIFTGISDSKSDDWPFWSSLSKAFIPPANTNDTIEVSSKRYNVFLKSEHFLSDNMFGNIKLGIYQTNFSNNWPKDNSEYRQSDATTMNLEMQLNNNLTDDLFITNGINILYNDINAFTYGNRYQQILSFYSQTEYTGIEDLIMNLGLRIDKEEAEGINSGTQFSPKLGLNYRVNKDLTIRMSGGKGFRAPQIAERYSTIAYQGFRVTQNPDLKAEHSWSAETGFNYYHKFKSLEFEADVSIFQNHMTDMIEAQLDEVDATKIKFVNLREARIRGTEISLRTFLFGFLGLETSLQLLDPWDLTDDKILKYRSKIISKSRFFLPMGDFRLEGNFRYLSKIERFDDLLAVQVTDANKLNDAYILDLRLNYDLFNLTGQILQLSFYSNNILNYYYTQMVGNMAPTRFVGLQLSGEI